MAKIKSETVRSSGKIEPRNKLEERTSQLRQCTTRWKSRQGELKGKLWGQCPEEIVADFVRCAARDVLAEYGGAEAGSKMMIIAAAVAKSKVSPDVLDMTLSCSVPGKDCGIQMTLTAVPESEATEEKPDVEFSLAVEQNELEQLDNKSVRDIATSLLDNLEDARPREVFDPLADGNVPDSEILRLVQAIDEQLPLGPNNTDSQEFDVLMTAGAVLLTWRQAEVRNASTVDLTLGGLTYRDDDVYPGQEVKANSTVEIFDKRLSDDLGDHVEVDLSFHNKRKNTP